LKTEALQLAPVRRAGRTGILLNAVAFQGAWFACVLGGAQGWPWAGAVLALLVVAVQLALAPDPAREVLLVAAVTLLGLALDSTLIATGWLAFASPVPFAALAPVWIVALWAAFATTLTVSLHWLQGRWLLAGALGALAGPLAYYAGARLGAVRLHAAPQALAALALVWALALPLGLALARRIGGRRHA
jgi:hypothetical protein